MRSGLAFVALFSLALAFLLITGGGTAVAAAPPLQLPWPKGHQHRILGGVDGGASYGCYAHKYKNANSSTAYDGNYYAIDFQFGVDGSPLDVSAVAGGTVVVRDFYDGYGNRVVLDHGGGYFSVYAHLQSFAVNQGAYVKQGTLLGYAGNTGGNYAVHLHFHMQNGTAAHMPEPMSRVTGFGGFGYCAGPTSPYWPAPPPYALIGGTLVKGSGNAIYILSGGGKRHIATEQAFNACGYKWNEVTTVDDGTLNLIPNSTDVNGPPCPYTLVRVGADPKVYAIWGDTWVRHIHSEEAFNACGYEWGDVVSVSSLTGFVPWSDVYGPPCPYTRDPWYHEALMNGTLVKGIGNSVYVIIGDQKRFVSSEPAFNACGYQWNDLVTVPDSTLNLIPSGPSIGGPPCPATLIKTPSDPAVYVVGWVPGSTTKSHVASEPVFNACGYIWGEVVTLSVISLPDALPVSAPPCPYTRQ